MKLLPKDVIYFIPSRDDRYKFISVIVNGWSRSDACALIGDTVSGKVINLVRECIKDSIRERINEQLRNMVRY